MGAYVIRRRIYGGTTCCCGESSMKLNSGYKRSRSVQRFSGDLVLSNISTATNSHLSPQISEHFGLTCTSVLILLFTFFSKIFSQHKIPLAVTAPLYPASFFPYSYIP